MAERLPTLMEAAVAAVGVVGGARVVSFMVAWQTAREALGADWPEHDGVTAQVQAYTEWWRQSERTSWRELDRFRDVWPNEVSPSRLLDAAATAWDSRRGVQGLGAVAVA